MVIATKYRVVFLYTGGVASVAFDFNSTLEIKQFLRSITDDNNVSIRVYRINANLNTSTHAVTFTQTELTEW